MARRGVRRAIRTSCWACCITWWATRRTRATRCKTHLSSAGSTARTSARLTNPRAWVFRVALNAGRDARGTAWRRHRRVLPDNGRQLVGDERSAEANAIGNEQLDMVREGIRRLRPEEQEVFLLRQDGQMTYEQIAETIGVPVGTVKTRMRLAPCRSSPRR